MSKKTITEKYYYLALLEQVTAEIAKINVDIEVYSLLPEDEKVGQDMEGNNQTAKEAKEIKQKNKEVFELKRKAINNLLNG